MIDYLSILCSTDSERTASDPGVDRRTRRILDGKPVGNLRTSGDDDDSGTTEFTEVLDQLKLHGCSAVACGSVDEEASAKLIRRWLGHPAALRRRVVLRLGASDLSTSALLPPEVDPTTTRIVDHPIDRSTAVEESKVTQDQLWQLRQDLMESVHDLDPGDRAYRPAELRVAIDNLEPLLETYPRSAVWTWVDELAATIVGKRGMLLMVVPRPEEFVESISNHVDILITMRQQDGGVTQQWHVPERPALGLDEPYETDWFKLK